MLSEEISAALARLVACSRTPSIVTSSTGSGSYPSWIHWSRASSPACRCCCGTSSRPGTLANSYGLEEHEYATLHFLAGCGPGHRATPSEIAAWAQMSPSGITGRLDSLERRGFIRRLPSAADRRKVIVELTEEGRHAWRSTFDPQTDEETKVLSALTVEEREQLNGMLRRMLRSVDRPGLLSTPKSSQSLDATARQLSRFTPDSAPE
jgi:DNA-binding MarR family transcriptional regulator